jgi:hypothetical protein
VDAKVIDMGAYDLMLGMDWHELYRPMVCDWLEKWIEFQMNSKTVRLQGIVSTQPKIIQEVSVEQVLKWGKGNYLWAAVLLEPTDKSSTLTDQYLVNGVPDTIKELIV